MTDLTFRQLADTAAAYEELLVPALFRPWAKRVAAAARIRPGDRVLDVACGTGVLARAAANLASPGGRVVGLDGNPGMLLVAERLGPTIDWRRGVAEVLPFRTESFDTVVSQFGLMLFDDRWAALRQMWRVLKPGGRLAVAVFDSLDNIPSYAALVAVYEQLVSKELADLLRVPFSLGDEQELSALFARADIEPVEITRQEETARFPDVRTMVLADVRGWFPLAHVHLTDDQIEAVVAGTADLLREYVTEDGSVVFPLPGYIITAEKD